jgi:hypothetical protein
MISHRQHDGAAVALPLSYKVQSQEQQLGLGAEGAQDYDGRWD